MIDGILQGCTCHSRMLFISKLHESNQIDIENYEIILMDVC